MRVHKTCLTPETLTTCCYCFSKVWWEKGLNIYFCNFVFIFVTLNLSSVYKMIFNTVRLNKGANDQSASCVSV